MRDVVRIGMLGCGTVGQGVVRILAESSATIGRATGTTFEIGPVLVRDVAKPREGVPAANLTTDPEVVLGDPDVGIIIEVMGGVEPTREWLLRALRGGTSVVTANKQLLARHAPELLAAAEEGGAEIRFEGAVCAAIPVIKVLRESLLAAEVQSVMGIVNGTTNYILTEMDRSGLTYGEALAQAQALGYAEADPSEDVGGSDGVARCHGCHRLRRRRIIAHGAWSPAVDSLDQRAPHRRRPHRQLLGRTDLHPQSTASLAQRRRLG